jgi:uncharacterized protein YxeA
MKNLLIVSFILNVVLGYLLVFQRKETKVVERLIVETHAQHKLPEMTDAQKERKEDKKKSKKIQLEGEEDHPFMDPEEFQNAGDMMEEKRKEFFTEKLGMTEDKIAEHNRLRDEFYHQSSLFWQKNPMKELSFKERRQMIDLEENFYKKLEKLHGKENWQRYQKFRETYNEKGQKRQIEEGEPFIFMGI